MVGERSACVHGKKATASSRNAVLLPGAGGALYSTTWYGGTGGNGTVFAAHSQRQRLERKGQSGYLQGITDGSAPAAGVVADAKGNLYGTTYKYDWENDGVATNCERRPAARGKTAYSTHLPTTAEAKTLMPGSSRPARKM